MTRFLTPSYFDVVQVARRASVLDDYPLEPLSVLKYVPSIAAAFAFGILYGIYAIIFQVRLTPHKAWFGLCLSIGCATESLGFWLRLLLRQKQEDLGLFIIHDLCIILSPSAFLAFMYCLFGKLIIAVDARFADESDAEKAKRKNTPKGAKKPKKNKVRSAFSFISPRVVAPVWVVSDIVTFCIQGAGGALETAKDPATAKAGDNIFLIGIILQAVSYLLFVVLTIEAHRRLAATAHDPTFSSKWSHPTGRILILIYFSSVFILIRCFYRVAELAEGYFGNLVTHEPYFLLLDSLPLLIGISPYIFFWPTDLIDETARRTREGYEANIAANDAEVTHQDATVPALTASEDEKRSGDGTAQISSETKRSAPMDPQI
ncbi:unnamed protein product [Tilletia laevis]|uniref:Uncharacterized protein n=2 Tax=Tilletia TaxID=13289 RepID=A0A177UJX5_9BASI|nr:hypothetical protein CF336_g2893 [Tilletia laevis]KAE8262694.1 hypothetical protein A4X03_0g2246 [Tilletia caries]CAD6925975.1 unnamed protein product [Tilletia controversa]KAE8206154.1 hypothetical protein CF335_g2058 [Tilletia laevis]CAD6888097.1 unnamed protein product [Tilletia caries]